MGTNSKTTSRADGITLSHAAMVLGRDAKRIDSLVRRAKVVVPRGKGGRGGEYRLDRDALIVLDTAARLDELNVPRDAIKRLVQRLAGKLDVDGEVAVIYAPENEDVIEIEAGTVKWRQLLDRGATIEIVSPKRQGAELERRLLVEQPPRSRGRPKLDPDWTRKKLDQAEALGDDTVSAEDLSRMIGDRGVPPWRRGR